MKDIWLKVLKVFQLDKNMYILILYWSLVLYWRIKLKFYMTNEFRLLLQLYFDKVCGTSFPLYEL